MEDSDKRQIQSCFTELVAKCNVDSNFINKLVLRNVFPRDLISIVQGSREEQVRILFLEIQKRGPDAFRHLIETLIETNQLHLALRMDPGKRFVRDAPRATGAVPFQLADYQNNISKTIRKIPNINISLRDVPLVVKVKKSTDFQAELGHEATVYNTRSKKRGMALVVNVKNVHNESPRMGSDYDVRNLKSLFQQCGMNVKTVVDPTDLLKEVKSFASDEELRYHNIIFVVLMGHGKKIDRGEYICNTDGSLVAINDLEALFANDNPWTVLKPKILMYQMCRGNKIDFGTHVGEHATSTGHRIQTDGEPVHRIHIISDTLIVHSTLSNYVANRDILIGSWFIQLFCEVCMTYAHKYHLEELLKITDDFLKMQRSSKNCMQVSEYTNKSFKVCYLYPGIYMEDENICHF